MKSVPERSIPLVPVVGRSVAFPRLEFIDVAKRFSTITEKWGRVVVGPECISLSAGVGTQAFKRSQATSILQRP